MAPNYPRRGSGISRSRRKKRRMKGRTTSRQHKGNRSLLSLLLTSCTWKSKPGRLLPNTAVQNVARALLCRRSCVGRQWRHVSAMRSAGQAALLVVREGSRVETRGGVRVQRDGRREIRDGLYDGLFRSIYFVKSTSLLIVLQARSKTNVTSVSRL